MNLSLQTAIAAMKLLHSEGVALAAETLSINEHDLKRFSCGTPWTHADRRSFTNILEQLIFGTCDYAGIPRFPVSSEFCAAAIYTFVSPCNYMTACHWIGEKSSSKDLADSKGQKVDELQLVKPHQLFALLNQMYASENAQELMRSFNKKTSIPNAHDAGIKKQEG